MPIDILENERVPLASLNEHRLMWSPRILGQIVEWVEAEYPEEGCGLLLERPDGSYHFRGCENLASKYHALDQERFPRTGRNSYIINPMELVRAEKDGERVAVVFHSHPEVGDYFSAEDSAAAVLPQDCDDEPLVPAYPGTDYLVVSVRSGRADRATLYRFNPKTSTFDDVKVFSGKRLQGAKGFGTWGAV